VSYLHPLYRYADALVAVFTNVLFYCLHQHISCTHKTGSAAGGSSRRRSTGTVGLKKDVAKEDTINQGGGAAAKVLVRVSFENLNNLV
jgi:hypothetical protein